MSSKDETVKVVTPGTLGPDDILRGTCGICGCVAETERKHTQLMRASKSENNILCLGIACPMTPCNNWIVMAKIASQ